MWKCTTTIFERLGTEVIFFLTRSYLVCLCIKMSGGFNFPRLIRTDFVTSPVHKARLRILEDVPPTRICYLISKPKLSSQIHNFGQVFVSEYGIGPTTLLGLFGLAEAVNFIPAVSLWLKVFGEFLLCCVEVAVVSVEVVVVSVVGNSLKKFLGLLVRQCRGVELVDV